MHDSLTNPDLAPTTPDQRTWSLWHIAALWVGMAVCIPTYMLAAGMIAQGMSWWQATLTVMLGNAIVLVPMILNGHAGTKHGIPFPVLVRASFGTTGAHIPAIARSLVACGWFGIQTWIGGAAIYQILAALSWINAATDTGKIAMLGITPTQLACFLGFWALHVLLILRGINSIKWVETWAAPFLLACGLALLAWAFSRVDDVSRLFPASTLKEGQSFWGIFWPQLTAMVGFWATLSLNIPDFTRYCRSQRDQAIGQAIGLPATMTLFCFVGIVTTAATVVVFGDAIWDPVQLASRIGASPVVVVLALFAVAIATLSTNIAANIVSPANGFANLWPSRIGFRTGAVITCLIGIAIMPWRLLDNLGNYIFTWLIGYSALLGPVAGIMLCDYFFIRRTNLNTADLYRHDGQYAYTRGINYRAVLSLLIAVLPNIPGFINAATNRTHAAARGNPAITPLFPEFFDHIYGYAWFVGLASAAILYFVMMRLSPPGTSRTPAQHA